MDSFEERVGLPLLAIKYMKSVKQVVLSNKKNNTVIVRCPEREKSRNSKTFWNLDFLNAIFKQNLISITHNAILFSVKKFRKLKLITLSRNWNWEKSGISPDSTQNSESEVPHTTTVYPIFQVQWKKTTGTIATFEKRELWIRGPIISKKLWRFHKNFTSNKSFCSSINKLFLFFTKVCI